MFCALAAMCGCIPIVVPEEGKNISDYLKEDDSGDGVAYGDSPEEIQRAIDTREKFLAYYDRLDAERRKTVECFIETCKEYFKEK